MNEAEKPEVIDYCGHCETEIIIGQPVIRYGGELLCSTECLCKRIGVVVIAAEAPRYENDPTG